MTNTPETPLIERTKLFGNPSRAQGRISPDGRWLSWLAPRDGVMNLWVAPSAAPGEARPMTAEKARPIGQYLWAADSSALLYVQDKGGDENFLLYRVDLQSGADVCLTPFENTRVLIVGTSVTIPDRMLIGLNNRDPQWHDVHSLDLATGELTEVMRGDGFAGFLADDSLNLRIAVRPNAAGGMDFFRLANGEVEPEPFASTTLDDSLTTQPAGFTTDGATLYWIDSRGRDTAALIAETVATGETRMIAEDPRADIGGVLAHPRTGAIEAYSVDYLNNEWFGLAPGIGDTLARLSSKLGGAVEVTSRTLDDLKWTVTVDPVTGPPAAYLFDRVTDRLELFYIGRPELADAPLVPMEAVEIMARDGLTLVSYLTRPKEAEGPTPMVLLVHGGPWARDHHGYNSYHQWLANRGYAVLSVNFRGSTGFGKSFISAGDLQWGAKMHDDLVDAVGWAVDGGIAQADKIAIMGGSYGGYATLAGLTFTPELFACGVDIVGPSNLETLLETIPPYWKPVVEQFHRRMGNPGTPEGLQLLRDRSPLHQAERIVRPLLIGQGANDPRVKQAESDQIADAMKAKGIPVTYVLFPDEGHGFARPENNIAFNAIAEEFLAANLGGRYEPAGAAVGASTAQFLARAE
jgi:dipeptidyl aminopeptidase/acylaminoacyl peptidase